MNKIDTSLITVKSIFLVFLSFISPIQSIIIAIFFLTLLDFITGIIASIKAKIAITSSGISRTVSKIFVYTTTIIVCHILTEYILKSQDFPILPLVSSLIAITEATSIFENLNIISNNNVITYIIRMLSNEKRSKYDNKK